MGAAPQLYASKDEYVNKEGFLNNVFPMKLGSVR